MQGFPALERAVILSAGYTVNFIIVWAFDDVLYPLVLERFGTVLGGIIMTLLSLVVCLLTIVYYDWKRTDWLGIEAYKDANAQETRVGRWTRFALLSLITDPFIVTAYMRDRTNQYKGLTRRDWKIFFSSLLISNGTWILVTMTSLSAVEGNIEMTIVILTVISLLLPVIPKIVGVIRKGINRAAS